MKMEHLALLDHFCRYMEKNGYLDSDWYAEHPPAIDRYQEEAYNEFLESEAALKDPKDMNMAERLSKESGSAQQS